MSMNREYNHVVHIHVKVSEEGEANMVGHIEETLAFLHRYLSHQPGVTKVIINDYAE